MSDDVKRPQVGVGVMIMNDKNEVLMGLRKNAHGAGQWSFPGGHLEFGEKIFDTAQREVKEECGLDVDTFELISVYDELDHMEKFGKHLVNIGVKAQYKGDEPQLCEPDRFDEWRWFNADALPENTFPMSKIMLRNFRSKKIYVYN